MQKIQDDKAQEIEQSGLADKDAFAELKKMAGEGGAMAHGEGLPSPPQPNDDPAVQLPITTFPFCLTMFSCVCASSYLMLKCFPWLHWAVIEHRSICI